jgi:hypothetical protein
MLGSREKVVGSRLKRCLRRCSAAEAAVRVQLLMPEAACPE